MAHPPRSSSGIYPVIPGMDIQLGDYGYWQGAQWCHVGNLKSFPDCPEFSKRIEPINEHVSVCYEVKISGGLNGEIGADGLKAGASIDFKMKNALYFNGILSSYDQYLSIDMELKPYLESLLKEGKWNEKYWLAYYVAKSNQFVSMTAKNKATTVGLSANFNLPSLQVPAAEINSFFSFNNAEIESVSSFDGEHKFAGAKFISLESKGLGIIKRKRAIRYNASGDDIIIGDDNTLGNRLVTVKEFQIL